MLALVASAVAMEDPWDCFEATSLPELQAVDADPSVAWEIAWAEVEGWVDGCLQGCADETPDCWEADCTTAEGAVVEYRATERRTDDGWSTGSDSEIELQVVAPDGWPWGALGATYTWSDSGSSTSSRRSVWGTMAWSGLLHEALPVDGTLTWSRTSGATEDSASDSASWDDGACRWSRSIEEWARFSPMLSARITMGSATGAVDWADCDDAHVGVFAGDVVGTVDPETWLPTGTTDADGDGWFAEDGDCDDADAAVYPCAAENGGDAVDSDCDGRVVDEDGDGSSTAEGDCDDLDDGAYPGATERDCNGIDEDCDGEDHCPDTGEHGLGAGGDDSGEEPTPSPDAAADAPAAEGGCGRSAAWLLALPLLGLRRRRG